MRKATCEYVRKNIYEYIAPLYYGKISLREVFRFFSDYGSMGDLEKCLDDLVKSGIAEKTPSSTSPLYIFPSIALEFGKRWKQELQALTRKRETVKAEIARQKSDLKLLEEIREIWQKDWKTALADEHLHITLKTYIATEYEHYLTSLLTVLQNQNHELNAIEKKIMELQDQLETSYQHLRDGG